MLAVFCILGALLSALLCVLLEMSGVMLALAFVGLTVACAVGLFLLYIVVLFVCTLFVDMQKPRTEDHPFVRFLIAETLRLVCQVGRVKIRVEGMEQMPESRFLLVSNHLSNFDPMIKLVAFQKYPMAFVTKPENLRIPLVGKIIRYCCFLPIDRENPRNAIRTIGAAAELIKNDTLSVGIYPEGTRNKDEKEVLLPFHAGVLMIAQKANVPIVVVTTQGTKGIGKRLFLHRTDVKLKVCEVIPAEEVLAVRTTELSDRIRETMTKELTKT